MWKKRLSELGFIEKGIIEAIVCTLSLKKKINAAPMGVTTEDMNGLILNPFINTQTYRNLLATKCATINITSNPTLYYLTLFKDANPNGIIPNEWFSQGDIVKAPKLKSADACLEVEVTNKSIQNHKAKVTCKIMKITDPLRLIPRAYCRGDFALIESMICASRVRAFISKGDLESAEKLIKLIDHYADLIKKVSPYSSYSRIIDDILRRIEYWKKNYREYM